jgi:AbrB family looped-hinge helix DNA binding protein
MGIIKVTKLNNKYQVTIPKEIRKTLKLAKGDFIAFEIQAGCRSRNLHSA